MARTSGSVRQKVDDAGRIRVPLEYRDLLGSTFYVARGIDGALMLMNPDTFESFYRAKFANVDPFDPVQIRAKRSWQECSAQVREDKQGRSLIPQDIRDAVNLGKNIIFISMGEYVELWSEQAWTAYRQSDYDQVMVEFNQMITDRADKSAQ